MSLKIPHMFSFLQLLPKVPSVPKNAHQISLIHLKPQTESVPDDYATQVSAVPVNSLKEIPQEETVSQNLAKAS
jgi:hypothetical protein